MKAVVLAAGRGTRMASVTGGAPKCLLRFGDRALIDIQLAALDAAGVTQLAIVVGHERARVIEHVDRRLDRRAGRADGLDPAPAGPRRVDFIVNPDYATTNNMYSLWLARPWLEDAGFLCLNADLLCDARLVRAIIDSQADIGVAVDREIREETTRVVVCQGCVSALSKTVPRLDAHGTFANLAIFSSAGARQLFACAEALLAGARRDQFFNDVVGRLAAGAEVQAIDVTGLPWAEVDDERDAEWARASVYPRLEGTVCATHGDRPRAGMARAALGGALP